MAVLQPWSTAQLGGHHNLTASVQPIPACLSGESHMAASNAAGWVAPAYRPCHMMPQRRACPRLPCPWEGGWAGCRWQTPEVRGRRGHRLAAPPQQVRPAWGTHPGLAGRSPVHIERLSAHAASFGCTAHLGKLVPVLLVTSNETALSDGKSRPITIESQAQAPTLSSTNAVERTTGCTCHQSGHGSCTSHGCLVMVDVEAGLLCPAAVQRFSSRAETTPGACRTLLRLPMRLLRAAPGQAGRAEEGHAGAEPEQAAHLGPPGFPTLSLTPPCTPMPLSAMPSRPAS